MTTELKPADIQNLQEKLVAARQVLLSLSAASKDSRDIVQLDQTSVGRLSRMDAMQSQAMAKATERRRESEIIRIDAALARIDNGDYGYCLKCDDEIMKKRLENDPAATFCLNCAQGKE